MCLNPVLQAFGHRVKSFFFFLAFGQHYQNKEFPEDEDKSIKPSCWFIIHVVVLSNLPHQEEPPNGPLLIFEANQLHSSDFYQIQKMFVLLQERNPMIDATLIASQSEQNWVGVFCSSFFSRQSKYR